MSEERKQRILTALLAELDTQSFETGKPQPAAQDNDHRYQIAGEIDVIALATAVDAALGADTLEAGHNPANTTGGAGAGSSPGGVEPRPDEGKRPEELNASNDE